MIVIRILIYDSLNAENSRFSVVVSIICYKQNNLPLSGFTDIATPVRQVIDDQTVSAKHILRHGESNIRPMHFHCSPSE